MVTILCFEIPTYWDMKFSKHSLLNLKVNKSTNLIRMDFIFAPLAHFGDYALFPIYFIVQNYLLRTNVFVIDSLLTHNRLVTVS